MSFRDGNYKREVTMMLAAKEYEIIEGVKYAMSPVGLSHSRVGSRLFFILGSLLLAGGKSAEYEVVQDAWLALANGGRIAPDLAVFRKPLREIQDMAADVPVLVIEILSPSTGKKDKTTKKFLYEKIGVEEYWIVNPKDESVEAYQLRGAEYELADIYQKFHIDDWNYMSDEEKAEHAQVIRLNFLGAEININEIFAD